MSDVTGVAPLEVLLAWMRDGTSYFQSQLDTLSDDELPGPSLLPGWSRAHVVAHMARNADALVNLLKWAETGTETPMYVDANQRDREIEASSREEPATLRADFAAASRRLESHAEELPGDRWGNEVRTAKGRIVPAAVVPWLRSREVWIHAIDLDTGAQLADLPPELLGALIEEITADLSANPACPNLELVAEERDARWLLGKGTAAAPTVRGRTEDLLAWLTGRTGPGSLETGDLAAETLVLPPWL